MGTVHVSGSSEGKEESWFRDSAGIHTEECTDAEGPVDPEGSKVKKKRNICLSRGHKKVILGKSITLISERNLNG